MSTKCELNLITIKLWKRDKEKGGDRQGESQKGAQRKVERAKSQQRRGVKKQSL